MNINFIGREFERLAQLEDFINYEYEPKSNLKYGKRNIYFDDIKLDFINEVNTYGFSPFILESFVEQRDNPNIMRFITKRFNHGLTNYVKLQTKGIPSHYKKNKKKLLFQRSMKNLKNNNTEKVKKKKQNLISNIFLIKKNEEEEDVKIDEGKNNFLKKALKGMGGNKLNIDISDINDDLIKNKKQLLENNKNNDTSSERRQEEKNIGNKIPLLKQIFGVNYKENIQKNNIVNNELPNILNNYDDTKQGKLKLFLDKINKVSLENKNYNNDDRKVLTLSKNRNILGNKRIFSPITKNNYKMNEQIQTFRKKSKLIKNKSMEPQNMKANIKFGMKLKNQKNNDTNEFLLFAKAIPYKYIAYGNIEKKEII
jgi:hypothetical protein